MLRLVAAGILSLACLHSQPELPVVRRGALAVPVSARLQISTQGPLIVRGQAEGNRIVYMLRALPGGVDAAKELEVKAGSRADLVTLSVATSDRNLRTVELTVDVPASLSHVVLETRAGNIVASDLRGEVLVRTTAGRIELDRLGSNLEVRSGGGEIRLGRVAGSVRCFSAAGGIRAESVGRESWFQTGGGDVVVRESGGPLHLSTAGGSIQVDRSAGEVFASTRGGAIKVGHVAGLVTAETAGGAIQVDTAQGVRCLSDAGTIRLRNVAGGPLRATTAVGSILAELFSAVRFEESFLSTGGGDITVFLSSNIPLTVQARSEGAGRARGIVSEFPEIRLRNALFAEGALNGGGPRLSILASGGTIYLRRQK